MLQKAYHKKHDSKRSETAPKTLHSLTYSVETVNTKEHCSMAIIGKTHFTYLKSRENKISSRNCNVSCKTGSMQHSKPTTCTRLSLKRLQTKTRRSQGCTVSLIAYWSKPCFTQENKVNIRLHYIVTNVKCLVSN